MPERVTVHINGRDFNIRSEYDEKYVSDIAYYVNKLIKDLLANNPRLDSLMATTLATVNVTDELFKAQKKLSEYENTPINKSAEYMDLNEAYQEALKKIEKLQEELNNKADELVKTKLNTEDLYQQLSRIKEGTSQDSDAKTTNKSNSSKATKTEYIWEKNGIKYPIYISSKGKAYIIRTSKKTGKEYKQYLPDTVAETIKKKK